jgi:predicted nucleic acid-binding protein
MSDELQFVDTNILIYAHDRSAGAKHEKARELIEGLWESNNGCLSVQVLQEFYINVTRKIGKPLNPEIAKSIVADLGQWTIHSPSAEDILDAITLQQRYGLSFWDAMMLASAIRLGCAVVWSEDLNDGQIYDGVKVNNPFLNKNQ